jgi:uncharacterized protein YjbI with pentapeptide repeats
MQFLQQQQASHDLLISNQVSKGFEQLGSDKTEVRLGGIYALEGVLNTSEQYHQPILEALCAFVRDVTRTYTGEGPPATDIQAALTVIGRRKAIETERPNLANVHIPKADLSHANLRGVDLSHANLSGALFVGADLSGSLIGSNVPHWMMGAHLSHANLSSADLLGANLSYADLSSTDLSHARLSDANLRHADLSAANLRGAQFLVPSGAWLDDADLSHTDLSGATIADVQLRLACGTEAKLDPGLTLKPRPASASGK